MDRVAQSVAKRWLVASHTETVVKVNALVDLGVAKVVELLNRHPAIRTWSSCQGRTDHYFTVWLLYGDDLAQTAEFMDRIQWDSGIPDCRVDAAPYCKGQIYLKLTGSNKDMDLVEQKVREFIQRELSA